MSAPGLEIRRELRPPDPEAIVDLHARVYPAEYGVDQGFVAHVRASVARATESGWPGPRGAIWLVERDGRLAGCLGLTDEGEGLGTLRWFVFEADLRGHGLGRRLVAELIEKAEADGYERLALETFSDLKAAAHLYRSQGFELVSSETGPRWGRNLLTYQHYELELAAMRANAGASVARPRSAV
jgi:N-acetylglutamate synthase-like GNAT family acetyltransferase